MPRFHHTIAGHFSNDTGGRDAERSHVAAYNGCLWQGEDRNSQSVNQ